MRMKVQDENEFNFFAVNFSSLEYQIFTINRVKDFFFNEFEI
jgi:hypothetical protein